MNPGIIFLLILIGAPLVELYVLIEVGAEIGALPTIVLSIFTAILGAALVRMQGLSVLMRVQATLARGETPALEMLEGAVLMLCGVMLLFPGFITDALGFLLLLPPLRRWLILNGLKRTGILQATSSMQSEYSETTGQRVRHIHIIQGRYRREEDSD